MREIFESTMLQAVPSEPAMFTVAPVASDKIQDISSPRLVRASEPSERLSSPISMPTVLERPVLETITERRQQARNRQSDIFARLSSLGVTRDSYNVAIQRSKQSGASVIQELFANGCLDEEDYFRKLAKDLGVTFAASINPAAILSDMSSSTMEKGPVSQIFTHGGDGLTLLHVAPDLSAESAIVDFLQRDSTQKRRIRICLPRTIAQAIDAKRASENLDWATSNLNRNHSQLSAKQVFAPWQAFITGAFAVALPVCLYHYFLLSLLLIQIFASVLFCVVIYIRLAALRSLKKRKAKFQKEDDGYFPKYSVLIALHKEKEVASQLIKAMSALDWPASRLEVIYVCEADDEETITALEAHGFPKHHHIMKVPAGNPRTKPKALNYALKTCSGEFLVIYDAEDRPHPLQLKEAWSKFARASEPLACLQAPLVVTNTVTSWFSRMFGFEYATHFKGLLPYLAEANVPLPLGGTSNHFKRSALEAVGAWDPYNVTEDADLGIRLYRFGFKCGVLQLPTLEDGPETFKEWFPQRTRWQKGWMQTFLVQNRNVKQLFDAIGTRNALYFEALLAGFILSPLLYFLSILMAAYSISVVEQAGMAATALNLSLLLMGYFSTIALGFEIHKGKPILEKVIVAITLPAYWLLLSAAAWRALYQLVVKPHHWEKTPHRPSSSLPTHIDPRKTLFTWQ